MASIDGILTLRTSDLSDDPSNGKRLCQDFCQKVERLSSDKGARVLILKLEQRENAPVYPTDNLDALTWRHQCADALRRISLPVIAVMDGYPSYGDFIVALGADFRFSDPKSNLAVYKAMIEGNMDSQLVRYVKELTSHTAPLLDVQRVQEDSNGLSPEMLATGVGSNPEQQAQDLAKALIHRSPDAISAAKRLYNDSWLRDAVYETLNQETYLGKRVMFRWNQLAAISRNFTKRPLRFRRTSI